MLVLILRFRVIVLEILKYLMDPFIYLVVISGFLVLVFHAVLV